MKEQLDSEESVFYKARKATTRSAADVCRTLLTNKWRQPLLFRCDERDGTWERLGLYSYFLNEADTDAELGVELMAPHDFVTMRCPFEQGRHQRSLVALSPSGSPSSLRSQSSREEPASPSAGGSEATEQFELHERCPFPLPEDLLHALERRIARVDSCRKAMEKAKESLTPSSYREFQQALMARFSVSSLRHPPLVSCAF